MNILNFEIKTEFDDSRNLRISALSDNTEFGNVEAWFVIDEIQINNVLVEEAYRRNGIASAMLETLIGFARKHECKKITLEVREGNTPAIELYKKHGFKQVGMRENYYQDSHENAILMDLNL